MTFSAFAEAFERGEAAAIAHRWQQLLDPASARARQRRDLHGFLVVASGEPRLCVLYPFISHHDLGFRRSVPDLQGRAFGMGKATGRGPLLDCGPGSAAASYGRADAKTVWDTEPVSGALGPAPAQESVALVLQAMDRDLRA